jgi:hypothetical protein
LPGDFGKAVAGGSDGDAILPITDPLMETLAQLADHHASIEIAMHLAAFTPDGPWLEWFDATGDPISISPTIRGDAVTRFAERIGGKLEEDKGANMP